MQKSGAVIVVLAGHRFMAIHPLAEALDGDAIDREPIPIIAGQTPARAPPAPRGNASGPVAPTAPQPAQAIRWE